MNGVIKLEVFGVIVLEAEFDVARPQLVLHTRIALHIYLL
ncbi:hypothetical protein ES703_07802 [subsurface metagenome]